MLYDSRVNSFAQHLQSTAQQIETGVRQGGRGGAHHESADAWLGEPAELIDDVVQPLAVWMEKASLSPCAPDAVIDLSTLREVDQRWHKLWGTP